MLAGLNLKMKFKLMFSDFLLKPSEAIALLIFCKDAIYNDLN